MWSKTVGFTLDEVTYAKENTREWHLKGNVEEVQFNLNIFCATNVMCFSNLIYFENTKLRFIY